MLSSYEFQMKYIRETGNLEYKKTDKNTWQN